MIPRQYLTRYYFRLFALLLRLTQKGQVTVPKTMRDRFGLETGTEVEFLSTEAGLLLRPRATVKADKLKAAISSIRGTADAGLSTDAIMQMTRD
jgi:AbrB family looped-hinge helix DNA binding protein